MNAMWAGFAATIVIAFVAYVALGEIGFSAEQRYTSNASVRLD